MYNHILMTFKDGHLNTYTLKYNDEDHLKWFLKRLDIKSCLYTLRDYQLHKISDGYITANYELKEGYKVRKRWTY